MLKKIQTRRILEDENSTGLSVLVVDLCDDLKQSFSYEGSSIDEGLDNIKEVLGLANELGYRIYAAEHGSKSNLLQTLKQYISGSNIFKKYGERAFDYTPLQEMLQRDAVKELLILGFNRDSCVFATVGDALDK